MFILKIKDSMDPSKTTSREVEFIHTVGKSSHNKSTARQQAINVLWQIALMEKPGYNHTLLKPARKHLFDLLRT
jgi:predicted metallopeptidase